MLKSKAAKKLKTKGIMVLIESEGLLYRGPESNYPTEVWHYPRGYWVPFEYAGRKEKAWGKKITARQAARLKKDNPAAEHFMYYDIPPWLQPPSQEYLDAVRPEHVKQRVAETLARRGKL